MLLQERFIQLAQRYQDMIFRLAFSYLKRSADADDITQDVLLRFYQSNRAFESEEHIKYLHVYC